MTTADIMDDSERVERHNHHSRLKIFETVPRGHMVHAITDHSCQPLVQPGEVIVATDERSLIPKNGSWYLVEWKNGTSHYSGRELYIRDVVIANQRQNEMWWFQRPASHVPSGLNFGDGPYDDFNVLADKILGEVVGIFRPRLSDLAEGGKGNV